MIEFPFNYHDWDFLGHGSLVVKFFNGVIVMMGL